MPAGPQFATQGATTTDAAAPTPPIPPASQLGQAVAALHIKPDGSSQMTIKLDPAELGLVQVRIGRAADGAATIEVAVERVDTLRALQADLTHLHLALDRAGVSDQRSLTLHLAPPMPPPATAGSDSSSTSPGGGSSQGGFSQSGFSQSGGSGQGARQPYAVMPSSPADSGGLSAIFTLANAAPAAAHALASINITA